MTPSDREEALRDEQRRMRRLRVLVDLTMAVLRHRPLSRQEALQIVEQLREEVLRLFPGKEESFEVIYRPRFDRIIAERFGSGPAGTGTAQ